MFLSAVISLFFHMPSIDMMTFVFQKDSVYLLFRIGELFRHFTPHEDIGVSNRY